MNAESMRITIVSDAISGRNGVGSYYDDLAENLEPHFQSVDLIRPPGEGAPREDHQWASVPLFGDTTMRMFFPRWKVVKKMFKANKPHVVVGATPGPYGVLGAHLARQQNARYCFAVHTDYTNIVKLYGMQSFASTTESILRPFVQWFFRYVHEFISPSQLLADGFEERHGRRPHVIGTPLAMTFQGVTVDRSFDDLRSVVYVGRFAKEKNLDAILEAAARLPHINFTLLGEGPCTGEVLEAAARHKNIHRLPWSSREGVKAAVDAADLLVLPSHIESFGTVALEAMSRARLTVVSRECGICEMLRDGEDGFVIGENQTLAEKLQEIAALTPRHRQAVAQAARLRAEEHNAAAIEDWKQLLCSVAGKSA
jgi:glycosyltransferase involved in cell wall biosynthesis